MHVGNANSFQRLTATGGALLAFSVVDGSWRCGRREAPTQAETLHQDRLSADGPLWTSSKLLSPNLKPVLLGRFELSPGSRDRNMPMRKGALLLTAGAVLLLAAGAVTRFVVLPIVHQVPSDVDSVTRYTGTISMLNPTALTAGDASKLFLTNVPVTAEQRVKAVSVSGSTVVMSSDTTVKGPDGATIITSTHVYSLDRVKLDAAPVPAGSNAETHTGLALGFPLTPEQKNYPYWDSTTQTASTAKYTKTEAKGGRDAYVYTTHAEGPIKDAKVQAMLPAALQQALAQVLPTLPDNIPLSYTSATDTIFWVDSATGIVLDVNQKQVIKAQLSGPLAAAQLPAVFDLSIKNTEETTKSSAESAAKADSGVTLIGTYIPIGLGALGLVLLVFAIIAAVRKRPTPVAVQ